MKEVDKTHVGCTCITCGLFAATCAMIGYIGSFVLIQVPPNLIPTLV